VVGKAASHQEKEERRAKREYRKQEPYIIESKKNFFKTSRAKHCWEKKIKITAGCWKEKGGAGAGECPT